MLTFFIGSTASLPVWVLVGYENTAVLRVYVFDGVLSVGVGLGVVDLGRFFSI